PLIPTYRIIRVSAHPNISDHPRVRPSQHIESSNVSAHPNISSHPNRKLWRGIAGSMKRVFETNLRPISFVYGHHGHIAMIGQLFREAGLKQTGHERVFPRHRYDQVYLMIAGEIIDGFAEIVHANKIELRV